MSRQTVGCIVALSAMLINGCGIVGPRKDSPPTGAVKAKGNGKQVAIASPRDTQLADPSTMIPPPPNMTPEIPPAPGPDNRFIAAAGGTEGVGQVVSAAGVVGPDEHSSGHRIRTVATNSALTSIESNLDALRRLHRRAAEQFQKLEGFECRLSRRETIGSKPMPAEELQYKFRREPFSLHLKWVGLENKGRELIYCSGKYDGKVQILTGRSEGILVPSGKRVARQPTDSDVRSKSRYDIREGGLGMSITWFGRVIDEMESDPAQANRLRYLGLKQKRERESGLEAVEEMIPPEWEPLLPKGGKRTTYFDPDPASPSFGLPILIVTLGDNGREVEYYWFDQFQALRPTDAEFDPDVLWKK